MMKHSQSKVNSPEWEEEVKIQKAWEAMRAAGKVNVEPTEEQLARLRTTVRDCVEGVMRDE